MNKRLFVGGLPFSATQDELKTLFAEAGTVTSVSIINDKFTGQSKGFGFVEMSTEEEATAAISKFDQTEMGGRKIIVAEAKPMEKRDFGDNNRSGQRGGFDRGRRFDRSGSGDRGGKRW